MIEAIIVDAERLEEMIDAVQCRSCPVRDNCYHECTSVLLDYLTETINPQVEKQ